MKVKATVEFEMDLPTCASCGKAAPTPKYTLKTMPPVTADGELFGIPYPEKWKSLRWGLQEPGAGATVTKAAILCPDCSDGAMQRVAEAVVKGKK